MEKGNTRQQSQRQKQLGLGYRTIRRQVMRRIFILYLYHRLTSPLCIKSYMLMLSLAGLATYVSIGSVLANMPPLYEVSNAALYSLKAFAGTELPVQVMTVMVCAVIAAMIVPAVPRLRAVGRALKPRVA